MKRCRGHEVSEEVRHGVRIIQDSADPRLQVVLPREAALGARSYLQSRGFTYSHNKGAWLFRASPLALAVARACADKYFGPAASVTPLEESAQVAGEQDNQGTAALKI